MGDESTITEAVDANGLQQNRSMGKLASKKSLLANGDQSVGSVGDINLTSESVGSMDHSSSSLLAGPPAPAAQESRVPTARRQVFCELLQTERNYVLVLDLIMKAGTDWRAQEAEASAKRKQQQLVHVPPLLNLNSSGLMEGGFKVPGVPVKEKDGAGGHHHGTLHQSLNDTTSSVIV
jgi:hypothetical protein